VITVFPVLVPNRCQLWAQVGGTGTVASLGSAALRLAWRSALLQEAAIQPLAFGEGITAADVCVRYRILKVFPEIRHFCHLCHYVPGFSASGGCQVGSRAKRWCVCVSNPKTFLRSSSLLSPLSLSRLGGPAL